MRKLAAGVLALPVVARLYLPLLARRRLALRLAIAFVVTGAAGVAVFGLFARSGAATPQTPIEPVPAALFSPILVDRALDAPVTIAFTKAMDQASVKKALDVSPAAGVRLSWDSAGRLLVVAPATHWAAGTNYDVSVGTTARDRTGHRLATVVHTLFLTRPATTGRLTVALDPAGVARGDATIGLAFDRPVAAAAARAALSVQPALKGVLSPTSGVSATFTFTPASPLPGGSLLAAAVNGTLTDEDGAEVAPVAPITFRTVPAATIVRSRPSGGARAIAAAALISIRFTVPMDRASTVAAFSVQRAGKPVAGKLSWSEHDTVLAFDPRSNLAAGATIRVAVTTAARSAQAAALAKPFGITFTVAKPAPVKPAARTSTKSTAPVTTPKPVAPAPKPVAPAPKPVAPPASGGGSAGSAPWYAVETYFLRLMNCTRTGGWITSGGSCGSIPSGLSVRPPATALVLDAGISTRVTRPYAKYLAVNGLCNHFYDGSPGDRLRRAGYTSYRWGENIGCPYGDPNAGMIAVERFFQNETPSGGHYVNLMNPAYDRAGIGVWVSSSRVRVVIDFYHP